MLFLHNALIVFVRYITGCFVLFYDAVAGFHHNVSVTTTSMVILMWAGIVF